MLQLIWIKVVISLLLFFTLEDIKLTTSLKDLYSVLTEAIVNKIRTVVHYKTYVDNQIIQLYEYILWQLQRSLTFLKKINIENNIDCKVHFYVGSLIFSILATA